MTDYSAMRRSRSGDPHPTLRLAALTAVIIGVILVAVAAFLLSYEGIHQIALQAGVSEGLARLYPLMFDAMLVIVCAAALALRSAGWGAKCYVWVSLLLVVGAVAVGGALHATGTRLTGQAARAAIAVIPWVLLLMGFGLWLVMLRQWRRTRAMAAADGTAGGRATAATAGGAALAGGAVTRVADRGPAPTRTGAPRAGIDAIFERQGGQAPGRAAAAEIPAGEGRTAQGDPPGPQRRIAAPEQLPPAAGAAAARAATAAPATAAPASAAAARAPVAGTEAEVARARTAGTAGTAGPAGPAATRTTQDRGNKNDAKPQGGATGGTPAGSRGNERNADRSGKGSGSGDRRNPPGGADDDDDGYVRLLPPQPKAPARGTAAEAPPAARARSGAQGTGATSGQDDKTGGPGGSGATPRPDEAGGAPGPGSKTSGPGSETSGQDGETPGPDGKKPGQDGKKPETGAGAAAGDHDGQSPTVPAPAPLPDFPRLRSTPTPPREKEASAE